MGHLTINDNGISEIREVFTKYQLFPDYAKLKNRNNRKRKVRYKQIRREQRIHTTRQFNISVYLIWGWLCGCEEKDAQIDSAYKLSIVKHNEEKKKKMCCSK